MGSLCAKLAVERPKARQAPGANILCQPPQAQERKQKKVWHAKQRYLNRKRKDDRFAMDLEDAQKLVGRSIEIFMPGVQKWGFATISDCKGQWRDMGTRFTVLHQLTQPKGSAEEVKVGGWMDLSQCKYVGQMPRHGSAPERGVAWCRTAAKQASHRTVCLRCGFWGGGRPLWGVQVLHDEKRLGRGRQGEAAADGARQGAQGGDGRADAHVLDGREAHP